MTQQPDKTAIVVSPQVAEMTTLSSPEKRNSLVCRRLLVGGTLERAKKEAAETLPKMLTNTQVLVEFGRDVLEAVNLLIDKFSRENPSVDVEEVAEMMRDLSRQMRNLGKKYDPSDDKNLEKYRSSKRRFLGIFRLGRSFLDEFLADIRSLPKQFDLIVETGRGKQEPLKKSIGFLEEFDDLNEYSMKDLIYVIAVMEEIRDLAAQKAKDIKIGDANLGDRGRDDQAKILDFVDLLEMKISAYQTRLWGAWGMAPVIRNMRRASIGESFRIDQSIDVSIPFIKQTIVAWLNLARAKAAAEFNNAVDDMLNMSVTQFARATQAAIPEMIRDQSKPPLDPRTIVIWSESVAAQAQGIAEAYELRRQNQAVFEDAMLTSKSVMDAATQKVNQARLDHLMVIAQAAIKEAPLQIARSVPAAQS